MKVGDLVLVTFPFDSPSVGIFLGFTKWGGILSDAGDSEEDDDPRGPPTRADVFWEGDIFSTPVRQIEVIGG